MKEFKYIKNIEGEVGTICLYTQIGDGIDEYGSLTYGISGSGFANEMLYLQEKCKKINVRINSIGGSVLDGYSIVSAILNSKCEVDTYIDGLAASIAGIIAVSGKKCYMADYGTLMIHNPNGANDAKLLSIVKDTLVTILSNRTALTPEDCDKMMNKETWLNSEEALNMGLIDGIITSKKKIKIKKDTAYNMALVYNKLINETPKMEKITNVLKLQNTATENDVVEAIEMKDNSIESLTSENTELKSKLATFEAAELKAKEEAATKLTADASLLVETAIKEGKIEETEKEEMITNAVSNYEFVKNMFSKISTVKSSVKVFDIKNIIDKKGNNEDRTDWTIRDWEKKDVTGLTEIKNSNPEMYQSMFDAFYKKTNK